MSQPVGRTAGRAIDQGVELAGWAAMAGASAVASIVLGGVFLEWAEPRTRRIPVVHGVVTDLLAVWKKVYNT